MFNWPFWSSSVLIFVFAIVAQERHKWEWSEGNKMINSKCKTKHVNRDRNKLIDSNIKQLYYNTSIHFNRWCRKPQKRILKSQVFSSSIKKTKKTKSICYDVLLLWQPKWETKVIMAIKDKRIFFILKKFWNFFWEGWKL